jgi:hypothetical protein
VNQNGSQPRPESPRAAPLEVAHFAEDDDQHTS